MPGDKPRPHLAPPKPKEGARAKPRPHKEDTGHRNPEDSKKQELKPRLNNRLRAVLVSFLVSTIVAALVGIILYAFSISINTILPVIAPVWVGTAAITYTVITGH